MLAPASLVSETPILIDAEASAPVGVVSPSPVDGVPRGDEPPYMTADLAVLPTAVVGTYAVTIAVQSPHDIAAASVGVSLPENLELISGSPEYSVPLQAATVAVRTIEVRASSDGTGILSVYAEGALAESATAFAFDQLEVTTLAGAIAAKEPALPEVPLLDFIELDVEQILAEVPDATELTEPHAAGTVTIRGRITWAPTWLTSGSRWLPYPSVRIYDDDGGGSFMFKGEVQADKDGLFSATVDNCDLCDGWGTGGIDVVVGVLTKGSKVQVGPTTCDCIYESRTGTLGAWGDGSNVDIGSVKVQSTAWNVFGGMTEAHKVVQDLTSSDVGWVKVFYPDSSVSNPTWFSNDIIRIPQTQAGFEVTQFTNSMAHEWVHHAMYWVAGNQNLLANCVDGVGYTGRHNEGCSLAEGYATWLPLVVNNSNPEYRKATLTANFESWPGQTEASHGADVPYRVAPTLWDLYDSCNCFGDKPPHYVGIGPMDFFSHPFHRIWLSIMQHSWQTPPSTWSNFVSNWQARGDSFPHMVNAGAINTIWLDGAHPQAEVIRPKAGCTYTQNMQTACGMPSTTIIGTSVTLEGRGHSDDVGILRVSIILDGSVKTTSAVETSSASWTWTFAASDFTSTHNIMVRAFDYAGRHTDATTENVAVASG